jgi:IMP dehydrogenase
MKKGLGFDDILLVPQYSDVDSRTAPLVHTFLGDQTYLIPIIPANLDCIATLEMRDVQEAQGGLFIHHRFANLNDVRRGEYFTVGMREFRNLDKWLEPIVIANDKGINICIDIANAHNRMVLCAVETIKKKFPHTKVMVGNIATSAAARDFCMLGVDCLKISIGSGVICSTRFACGVGVPAVTCIKDCVKVCRAFKVATIYDGGIDRYDKACKALALGCDFIMMGGAFAKCKEVSLPEIDGKSYYWGQSSIECREKWYNNNAKLIPEGIKIEINNPYSENATDIIDAYIAAIKSSMTYLGAKNIEEYHKKCRIIKTNKLKE